MTKPPGVNELYQANNLVLRIYTLIPKKEKKKEFIQ